MVFKDDLNTAPIALEKNSRGPYWSIGEHRTRWSFLALIVKPAMVRNETSTRRDHKDIDISWKVKF